MANAPLSLEEMRQTVELIGQHGTIAAAARAADVPVSTLKSRYYEAKRAAERGAFGTDPVIPGFRISKVTTTPRGDFIQQQPERGPAFELPDGHRIKGVSALVDGDGREVLKWVKTGEGELSLDAITRAMREAFTDVPRSELTPPPSQSMSDALTIYPIVDWHVGLLAWAEECGENYDLKIAQSVILDAMRNVIAAAPPSRRCIILGLGDLMHFDGYEHVTTKSGNFLDGDGRYPKVLGAAARMVIETIDLALLKHEKVLVRMNPGNHDTRSTVAINLALSMRYEGHARVTVDDSPSYFWWHRFGKNFFGATHGDKAKMKDLPLVMAHDRPHDWAASTHRRIYTGHIHHERRIEEGGVIVLSMRTPVVKDAYHSFNRWRSGRSVYAETFREDGSSVAEQSFNI